MTKMLALYTLDGKFEDLFTFIDLTIIISATLSITLCTITLISLLIEKLFFDSEKESSDIYFEGTIGVAFSRIDKLQGQIIINGSIMNAKTLDDKIIEKNMKVMVEKISEGVLCVKNLENDVRNNF